MRAERFIDDLGNDWTFEICSTRLEAMRGLLGRDGMAPATAMLFPRSKGVHTLGMRFTITVAFLDADLRVLSVVRAPPGRLMLRNGRAVHVLELDGSADVEPGRRFERVG